MPPNIGPRGRAKRLAAGKVILVAAVAAAATLLLLGVARPWRLVLVAPLYGAMVGFFQARDKT